MNLGRTFCSLVKAVAVAVALLPAVVQAFIPALLPERSSPPPLPFFSVSPVISVVKTSTTEDTESTEPFLMFFVRETGNIVNRYAYTSFGVIDWDDSFEGVANRYTFQGREYDAERGDYYFRNRLYFPDWGLFSGPDMNLAAGPYGEAHGMMSYVFCANDPWTYGDPMGLAFGDWWDYRTHAFITGGFFEGLGGGTSILVNTFTFGGADKMGLTESDQYQGGAYSVSRVSSTIAREALITAGTMGIGNAARGGTVIAQTAHKAILVAEAGTGGYQVGTGINKIQEGDNLGGTLDILGGGLRVGGSLVGAREINKWKDSVEKIALISTKNPESNILVLGKFREEGSTQVYTKVGAHYKASYLKIENWNEVTKGMGEGEKWMINEAFLRQRLFAGRKVDIVLSHNPASATGFFKQEVKFLEDMGYKFIKEGWVWRAIK